MFLRWGPEQAVYQRCGHGLLHPRVNRVTLTLKLDEFSRLAIFVGSPHPAGAPAQPFARALTH